MELHFQKKTRFRCDDNLHCVQEALAFCSSSTSETNSSKGSFHFVVEKFFDELTFVHEKVQRAIIIIKGKILVLDRFHDFYCVITWQVVSQSTSCWINTLMLLAFIDKFNIQLPNESHHFKSLIFIAFCP